MGDIVVLRPSENIEVKGNNLDVFAFRKDILRPALKSADLWSMGAENLLLGTAIAGSNLDFVKQISGGDKVSFFTISKKRYEVCQSYLKQYGMSPLKDRILSSCFMDIFPQHEALAWNLRLSCLIARVFYLKIKEPMPADCNVEGMADYWLEYYNEDEKKGRQHYIDAWRERT